MPTTMGIGRRGRLATSAAVALLLAGGATGIGLGLHPGHSSATEPVTSPASVSTVATSIRPATASPVPASPSAPTDRAAPPAGPSTPPSRTDATISAPVLPASAPVSLDVPAVGVRTRLIQLGQRSDGTIEVPPVTPGSPAGWYRYSPTPGQIGPSVILGHVNSTAGPVGVFRRLNQLRPGRRLTVTRADGIVAVFQVDRTADVQKERFPTQEVYGNTVRAELRLITCGDYDFSAHRWRSNVVVFAHLLSSHPA